MVKVTRTEDVRELEREAIEFCHALQGESVETEH